MPVKLRAETPADAGAIERLTAAAFAHAPHASHTEQYIVNALRRAGRLPVSLVAEDSTGLVGHVAVSPVTIAGGASGWYGLGPISVAPKRQRQGIGSQLMTAALAALRERGAAGCVVLGDPAYYARFGFAECPGLVLPGVPSGYFQAISFDGHWPAGSVSYHDAFNATQ